MSYWPVWLEGLSCSNRDEEKRRRNGVWEDDQELMCGDAEVEIAIRHLRECGVDRYVGQGLGEKSGLRTHT